VLSSQDPQWQVNESDSVIEAGWQYMMCRSDTWHVIPEQTNIDPPLFIFTLQNLCGGSMGKCQKDNLLLSYTEDLRTRG